MFLYKRNNGFYYIFYQNRFNRRTCISTKSKTKNGALTFLTEFKEELKKRESQKTIPINMKKFFFDYLVYSELIHSRKTVLTQKTSYNELLKFFPDMQIMELTRDKIMDFVQYRLRKTSPYAAKRDIQYLSSAFNWGIQKNYLESNPCVGIKRPRLPEKQPLYFTNEEFDRLLNVIDNADLKDVILFAVNTGLRQMELLRLKWEQINFPEKLLYVNNQVYMSKTLRIRTIPLNYKALEILNKRFVNKQEEYIFTYQGKIIKQELMSHKFKNYVITSGVNSKLNFHSLRHTFASWLVQRGATIYDVSKLLGHSTIKSTEIYAHLRVDELRNAVEKLN